MRRPARRKSNRGQVSRTYSTPAPIKGWNARDSVAAMAPGYAVVLKNWFPTTADVVLRKGMAAHATGLPDEVETLMTYRPVSGAHELFAISDDSVFDVTSAGAVGAAVVSGLSNAQWQWTNATTIGGNFIMAVNGVDNALRYDGTTWLPITGVSTPAITGIATSALVNVTQYKGRTYSVEKDSLSVWYSGIGALTGALTEFPLGSIFRNGGHLVAMSTWTLDSGSGVDDLAVFITSTGEVAVYAGTDPATNFAIIGIFNIAKPIGYRCFTKYQGDLLIITQDGLDVASRALLSARGNKNAANTAVIAGATSLAASQYGENFGWEVAHFAGDASMLLLNVPVAPGQQEQYVMNTTTGAWCQFTNWHANTFAVLNDELYFGGDGFVRKAWTGTSDLGSNIVGELVGAFDYFGNSNGIKIARMIRPVVGWDSNPTEFLVGIDVDFIVNTPTGAISFPASSGAIWDTGVWDSSVWGGSVVLNRNWYSAFGTGYAFAPHILVATASATIRLAAIDYLFEQGGVL
jgi:hypothetical protein